MQKRPLQTDIEDIAPRRRAVLQDATAAAAAPALPDDGGFSELDVDPVTHPSYGGQKRRRHALLDLDAGGAAAADTARGRGAAALAAARKDPVNIVLNEEASIGYTEWDAAGNPPCTGYWEDNRKGGVVRVWYDARRDIWRTKADGPVCLRAVAWRGLKRPWPAGYDYAVRGALCGTDLQPWSQQDAEASNAGFIAPKKS